MPCATSSSILAGENQSPLPHFMFGLLTMVQNACYLDWYWYPLASLTGDITYERRLRDVNSSRQSTPRHLHGEWKVKTKFNRWISSRKDDGGLLSKSLKTLISSSRGIELMLARARTQPSVRMFALMVETWSLMQTTSRRLLRRFGTEFSTQFVNRYDITKVRATYCR